MELQAGKNNVTFKSQGVNLSGLLFTPENFDTSKKYPTIVFSGPFNQVKEQMGALYGQKFANKGYVFLSFDHLGYGDSEGELRNNEHSFIKMESIRDAISYLRTLSFVNKEKLYGYGACASGGYIPLVAVTDKRLKAIATVSGMMDNQASYFGIMTKEQLIPIFAMANEARQKQYETGKVEYYDALGMETLDPNNLPEGPMGEGYDYYMTPRAGKETYKNYTHLAPKTLMENAPITSAVTYAPYLYTPYLGIVGEKAQTAPLTKIFFEKASEPKEFYEVPGASHVSLYDIDQDVDKAVEKMDEFFSKY
ncbi:uncharacterized protein UJ101_00648 [Flavobacteriaceae bacterium UJ101]|nr:uncharacterized protein UJ101_00648 [Flavobacteriaceae bacterium UJ101]